MKKLDGLAWEDDRYCRQRPRLKILIRCTFNYRDWCGHCVSGKAGLAQHKVEPADRERLGVSFSADYAFTGSDEAEEGMQPTLVMSDDDQMAFRHSEWPRRKLTSQ